MRYGGVAVMLLMGVALMAGGGLSASPVWLGRCTGSSTCKACKNCEHCKHCAKEGHTCGVCRERKHQQVDED
jgi:hypothetical protein